MEGQWHSFAEQEIVLAIHACGLSEWRAMEYEPILHQATNLWDFLFQLGG